MADDVVGRSNGVHQIGSTTAAISLQCPSLICNWRGDGVDGLVRHVGEVHDTDILDCRTMAVKIRWGEDGTSDMPVLMRCYGVLFAVQSYVKNGNIYLLCTCVDGQRTGYFVKLALMSNDTEHKNLAWEGRPLKLERRYGELEIRGVFHVDRTVALRHYSCEYNSPDLSVQEGEHYSTLTVDIMRMKTLFERSIQPSLASELRQAEEVAEIGPGLVDIPDPEFISDDENDPTDFTASTPCKTSFILDCPANVSSIDPEMELSIANTGLYGLSTMSFASTEGFDSTIRDRSVDEDQSVSVTPPSVRMNRSDRNDDDERQPSYVVPFSPFGDKILPSRSDDVPRMPPRRHRRTVFVREPPAPAAYAIMSMFEGPDTSLESGILYPRPDVTQDLETPRSVGKKLSFHEETQSDENDDSTLSSDSSCDPNQTIIYRGTVQPDSSPHKAETRPEPGSSSGLGHRGPVKCASTVSRKLAFTDKENGATVDLSDPKFTQYRNPRRDSDIEIGLTPPWTTKSRRVTFMHPQGGKCGTNQIQLRPSRLNFLKMPSFGN